MTTKSTGKKMRMKEKGSAREIWLGEVHPESKNEPKRRNEFILIRAMAKKIKGVYHDSNHPSFAGLLTFRPTRRK
jgi:hypothetical protein